MNYLKDLTILDMLLYQICSSNLLTNYINCQNLPTYMLVNNSSLALFSQYRLHMLNVKKMKIVK